MGGQTGGNRQDNRQRGNAAQLLEKYKSMARDAQLAGDRVQSEYYLQFAEHYFRVLSENRARFEEQNPRRQRDDDMDDEDGEDMDMSGDDNSDMEEEQQQPRREHSERRDRGERTERPSVRNGLAAMRVSIVRATMATNAMAPGVATASTSASRWTSFHRRSAVTKARTRRVAKRQSRLVLAAARRAARVPRMVKAKSSLPRDLHA